MKYQILELDKRYNGSHFAKWRVELDVNDYIERIQLWNDIRNWCDETWGHSSECVYHRVLKKSNPHWCWHHPGKFNQFYFMFASDQELALFKLKFS